MNQLDVALVHAIDTGNTLVTSPMDVLVSHKRNFFDIEVERFYELVIASFTRDSSGMYPQFDGMCDFDISEMHLGTERSSMLVIECASFHMDKRGRWSVEMCAAEDAFVDAINTSWRVDWTNLPHFQTIDEGNRFLFEKVYVRYAAYMELQGLEAVRMDDIQSFEQYPYEMQLLDRMFVPQRYSVVIPPTPQMKRNRGTPWEVAPVERQRIDQDTLVRSLEALRNGCCIDNHMHQSIVGMISNVVVQTRLSAENTMSNGKTDINVKRGKKPGFRYAHPLFTREGMDMVLMCMPDEPGMKLRKRDNTYGHIAASRDVCLYYILFMHNIDASYWPYISKMKKPRRNM